MFELITELAKLYLELISCVLLGWLLAPRVSRKLPFFLGQYLFWFGVPIGIIAFLRRTDLSGQIWLSPFIAIAATLLGGSLAWAWVLLGRRTEIGDRLQGKPVQGSFLLSSMFGNTGYIGYPVSLALVGEDYFGWAVFYDLGTTVGAYGLGVLLAAYFGQSLPRYWQLIRAVVGTPALWAMGIGLWLHALPLPETAQTSLQILGWSAIFLSLILIGMRLSQLYSWQGLPLALVSLSIKMLLVPLVLGIGISAIGITGVPQLVIVLQMAMPPAFATLIVAEAYQLDQQLTVTTLAVGSSGLLLTLPGWLLLFGDGF